MKLSAIYKNHVISLIVDNKAAEEQTFSTFPNFRRYLIRLGLTPEEAAKYASDIRKNPKPNEWVEWTDQAQPVVSTK